MIKFLLKLTTKISAWLAKPLLKQQLADRQTRVQDFVFKVIPSILHPGIPEPEPLPVIMGGKYNLFELPSGEMPKFDFVLPSYALYLCVLGIESASWPEARLYGVSRERWEAAQLELDYLQQAMAKEVFNDGEDALQPRLLILRWEDTLNFVKLTQRTREILGFTD
jgi:hypothetical protein